MTMTTDTITATVTAMTTTTQRTMETNPHIAISTSTSIAMKEAKKTILTATKRATQMKLKATIEAIAMKKFHKSQLTKLQRILHWIQIRPEPVKTIKIRQHKMMKNSRIQTEATKTTTEAAATLEIKDSQTITLLLTQKMQLCLLKNQIKKTIKMNWILIIQINQVQHSLLTQSRPQLKTKEISVQLTSQTKMNWSHHIIHLKIQYQLKILSQLKIWMNWMAQINQIQMKTWTSCTNRATQIQMTTWMELIMKSTVHNSQIQMKTWTSCTSHVTQIQMTIWVAHRIKFQRAIWMDLKIKIKVAIWMVYKI